MKTMTCKTMGGPCDEKIQGATADEMMTKGGNHVNEMAESGDQAHIEAKKMMDEAGKLENKADGDAWFKKFNEDWEATPED